MKRECIRITGARQNNLKGFDIELPLGCFIVVTGLSGAGKSSLVLETLHAEGQRRYIETFSAYTRQFLDLLDRPRVGRIEGARPSIAIEQTNTVKTSRSTVGTMTELTDFFKVWFSHTAGCFDPETGEPVEDDDPASVWEKTLASHANETVAVAFRVAKPANLDWSDVLGGLKNQGFLRYSASTSQPSEILVIADRIAVRPENRPRFIEAAEGAMHFGRGEVRILGDPGPSRPSTPSGVEGLDSPPTPHDIPRLGLPEYGRYSRGLHSPLTGRTFRAPTPGLFSFNSPLGACPRCRGFGRVIEIDYRLAIPDWSLSIDGGAIKCWEGKVYSGSLDDLRVFAKRRGIPTHAPFADLTPEQQRYVIDGEPGYGEEGREWPEHWYGVKGFFRWLEKNTYKMHIRVFLSRFRAYNPCPDCGGTRLQPEALCWRYKGRTLPELYRMPVSELLKLMDSVAGVAAVAGLAEAGLPGSATPATGARSATPRAAGDEALSSILTRLHYLDAVGLGYLSLDRPSRTLSGGEVERVNLTSCLGTSLVDTMFVLDEPSVGLHPRDVSRLIGVIRSLAAAGNTVIVVEHDEALIRAADHVIEVGPEPGPRGGEIVFQGGVAAMLRSRLSLTGAYLAGRRSVEVPSRRRPVDPRVQGDGWLRFAGASKHNIVNMDLRIPLRRLVCVSGVSGAGKSTLLDNVIHQGLLSKRRKFAEDPATVSVIAGDSDFGEVVMVDQSPLSRTPRSNPALYAGAWDGIRDLFAATPEAAKAGFTASSFSFNGGDGRCDHCQGRGSERVEMQFLSDVFVPCPVCDGRRFKPEVLSIAWNRRNISEILELSIDDAKVFFGGHPKIEAPLSALSSVGLGYVRLGQPLNTLSGGESQRLKLVRYLGSTLEGASSPSLLLLDEPTTGLHRHDVKRLISVLNALVDQGHSVVVIEHNLDVLKSADWILEIGPEAGSAGGRIVASGTPEHIASLGTATSPFLREALSAGAPVRSESIDPRADVGGLIARLRAPGSGGTPGNPAPVWRASEPWPPQAASGSIDSDRTGAPQPNKLGSQSFLEVVGARENNLKNISVKIPHRKMTVVTGISGSGKSTLAFDIIFAEGQRRFMESMSPYARQFVEQLPKPAVDRISGIPPTVAIEQRVTRGTRKSTVATITEVAQYLRLLYARIGIQHYPDTDRPVEPSSRAQLQKLLARTLRTSGARREKHLYLCAPLVRGRKGHHQPIADWIAAQGYEWMRVDGRLIRTASFRKLDRYKEHDVEAAVADVRAPGDRSMSLDDALRLGNGSCFLLSPKRGILSWFSTTRTDVETGESFPELDPKHFSFNSPRGWCPACRGFGRIFDWMLEPDDDEELPPEVADIGADLRASIGESKSVPCPECRGERLNRVSRAVKLRFGSGPALSLPALLGSPPARMRARLAQLALDRRGRIVAKDIVSQISSRLRFLESVGLGYLSLDRATETLSGGEAQRIRLAAQLGSNLSGVLYVLDEPSIGLHACDSERLIRTMEDLRARGNTLLVVEHDEDVMARADLIIDLGPGAGSQGGEVLAADTPAGIKGNARSLTGLFLSRGIPHPIRGAYRPLRDCAWLELDGARFRNLKGFDLKVPLGRLVMAAGPSGAGKSSLFRDLLGSAAAFAAKGKKARLSGREFVKKTGFESQGSGNIPPFVELRGAHAFRSVIEVDQSPIGKTPRSTPATYLGIFDLIRKFFASLPDAKMRGYSSSRFSFNVAGGRCKACEGAGRIRLEMAFMPDAYVPCEECAGLRYAPELSDIAWKGKSIGKVLRLTFDEACEFFSFHAQLSAVCRLMSDCGLGYLELGQSSPTLSGGEAQRLKLVAELSRGLATVSEFRRGQRPQNLYLLEEPTIGLHLSDCEKLIRVLHALVDQGHSVIVIEHHLDLLAEADSIVELGPAGGPRGGELIHQGPLEGLLQNMRSPTAPYLRKLLNRRRSRSRRGP